MRRRPGITLVEVLVAIFIMAIGLLALLTLFPLGALRMATALQDERAATAANAGANICDAFGMRLDPQFDPSGGVPSIFLTPPTPGYPGASKSGAGIPIYIDPWGVAGSTGVNPGAPLGASTATNPQTPGITRLAPTVIHGSPFSNYNSGTATWIPVPTAIAARYFTLPDDMTFVTNGLPDTTPGFVQRAGRYTWAYLLKRPQPGYVGSPVDLTVVVYAGRPTQLASAETTYPAQGLPNSTSVTLTIPAGQPPSIRRGTWILDTTYNPTTGSVNGDFYRVVSITTVSPTLANLELQTPITKQALVDGTNALTAVTVMDDVVEVFFRGVAPSSQWEFHAQP